LPGDDATERAQSVRSLVQSGAEIAGGAVGGALGFLAGGPGGAAAFGAAGVATAMALKYTGGEIADRLLGPRERKRLGGVLALAASEIAARIEAGESPRQDGFFDSSSDDLAGEEVIESILQKSQREPEEKKLPYMAHLLASVSFDDTVSPELAHQLSKAAEQLTYRQLCLLRLAVAKDGLSLRASDYRGQESFDRGLYQVLYECLDLYSRGFVNFGGEVAFGPTDVKPGSMTVQGLGADLHNLMQLSTIPVDELAELAHVLR